MVGIASTSGCLAADQIVGAQIGKHGHLSVQQSHVDMLALTCLIGMPQGCQNANGGIHAREQIGHCHAHFLRAAAKVIALACDTHQATNALHSIVIASPIAVGACLPKACDAAIDKSRVDGLQTGVVQAITGHVTDLEVFNEDIAVRYQFKDQSLTIRLGNITRK